MSSGMGGAAGTGVFTLPPTACVAPDYGTPVFADQAVMALPGVPRELYTWTTPEQIAEIRSANTLLTRTERDGQGPGYAVESLSKLATTSTDSSVAALASLLSGDAFAKARYAWPHPWATRMGWPGETYGNQLVRMVLREDALVVLYQGGTLRVTDLLGNNVSLADALADPTKIAGFFFMRDGELGGPFCGGSFTSGSDGYREFVIGNEAMIEEWSFGTDVILARLEADIAALTEFLARIRACPEVGDAAAWNLRVCCAWPGSNGSSDEQNAYEMALAMPSPAYLPAPATIATMIETLEADRFDPDPFIVNPAPPGGTP